jgi:hypothetical protein
MEGVQIVFPSSGSLVDCPLLCTRQTNFNPIGAVSLDWHWIAVY